MNPLIYGMASPEYRRTLRNMFRSGWRKAVSMALASADLTSQNYNSENENPDKQMSRQPSCSTATANASSMQEKKELSNIEISTIESIRAWGFFKKMMMDIAIIETWSVKIVRSPDLKGNNVNTA